MTIDRFVRSKRKTIAIEITREGLVVVRAPLRASRREIDALISSRKSWIERKRNEARKKTSAGTRRFVEGEEFFYLGKTYPLSLVNGHDGAKLCFRDGKFLLSADARENARDLFTAWYRARARRYIGDTLPSIAGKLGMSYARVRITSARTRWGSCSSKGSLNFSWRLVMAPPDIIEYVVVHELVHLKEQNHSSRYWKKVESILPDYRALRDRLRREGHLFSLN